MASQVKSKERVSDFGEVFTNEREVNAMLDLVKEETENIDSTFLEPACGDGNFLCEILKRKLSICKDRYSKIPDNYEKFSIIAVTSLYGVDILEDNVDACRKRLYKIWEEEYKKICKKYEDENCKAACKYILSKNILCGDALTLLKNDGTPIVFPEWKLVSGNLIKRRDYEFAKLLEVDQKQIDMFWLLDGWEYDEETKRYIPAPIKEYSLIDYKKVMELE